jgi:hypothetical protein
MYHFGYGSNLQLDFLKTLLPGAKFAPFFVNVVRSGILAIPQVG